MDYEKFESINISSLNGFFPEGVILALGEWEIFNLSELFKLYDKGKLSFILPEKYLNNVLMGVKLLKCKYFDEEPLIDVNNNDIDDICRLFGFSAKIKDSLRRYCVISPNFKFFDVIKSSDSIKELCLIRNIGKIYAREIYERAIIVINYYDRHKNDENEIFLDDNDKAILEYLYAELEVLKKDRDRIDMEIELLLLKIEEKKYSIKGGVKK